MLQVTDALLSTFHGDVYALQNRKVTTTKTKKT